MIKKSMTRLEVASIVSQTLFDNGITTVLSGGSVVSIYSSELYVSDDLDFVDCSVSSRSKLVNTLSEIGYLPSVENPKYFVHPEVTWFLEFPSSPLAVGDQILESANAATIKTKFGTLRLLTATDCVKDRLCAFLYFGDRQGLLQAQLVVENNVVDKIEIVRWLKHEKPTEKQAQEIKAIISF